MKKLLALLSLAAWMVVTGDGHLVPASQDRIFFADQSVCMSVASGLGQGARCTYVSAPSSMTKD